MKVRGFFVCNIYGVGVQFTFYALPMKRGAHDFEPFKNQKVSKIDVVVSHTD